MIDRLMIIIIVINDIYKAPVRKRKNAAKAQKCSEYYPSFADCLRFRQSLLSSWER